jgi:hypothetical protein
VRIKQGDKPTHRIWCLEQWAHPANHQQFDQQSSKTKHQCAESNAMDIDYAYPAKRRQFGQQFDTGDNNDSFEGGEREIWLTLEQSIRWCSLCFGSLANKKLSFIMVLRHWLIVVPLSIDLQDMEYDDKIYESSDDKL